MCLAMPLMAGGFLVGPIFCEQKLRLRLKLQQNFVLVYFVGIRIVGV